MGTRITGMVSGLDTESIISALVSTEQKKVDKLTSQQTKHSWTQDAWKDLNKEVMGFFNSTLGNMRFTEAFQKKTTDVSNSSAVSVVTGTNAMNTTQELEVTKIARSAYLTGEELKTADGKLATKDAKLSELGFTGDTQKIELTIGGNENDKISVEVNGNTTVSELLSKLKEAKSSVTGTGVNVNFDEKNGRFYVAATSTGEKAGFAVSSNVNSPGEGQNDIMKVLGFTSDADHYVAGQSAEIRLNGATYTSEDNTFEINGLTITAKQKTDAPVTLTTRNDTSGIYDMIKNFLKEYNKIINKMDELYNADAAKSYDVLTSDEKKAMTDDEIEEWNKKIKDGLLSGNETLYNFSSAVKNVLADGIEIGGVKMFLSDFGIDTLGYFEATDNERYAYHIDGDADDTNTSGKENKLQALIASDPDKVTSFFTQMARNLYSKIQDQTKGIDQIRSSYTIYEDKLMASQYSSYTKSITTAQEKLTAKEDKYYKKFGAMETALSKLQNQSGSLGNFFGTGS